MTTKTFSPGDVVVLKSGGPMMTIYGPAKNEINTYLCQWFGGGKKLESAFLHANVLKATSPSET